eukprot:EG_transcript_49368
MTNKTSEAIHRQGSESERDERRDLGGNQQKKRISVGQRPLYSQVIVVSGKEIANSWIPACNGHGPATVRGGDVTQGATGQLVPINGSDEERKDGSAGLRGQLRRGQAVGWSGCQREWPHSRGVGDRKGNAD